MSEQLKATLEIETNTNKAKKDILKLIQDTENKSKDVAKALEKLYSDKRIGSIKKGVVGSILSDYKEQRKLFNISQRNVYGKASRAISSEGALIAIKKSLSKDIFEYENKNEPIAEAKKSLEKKEKEKEKKENERIRQKYLNKQNTPLETLTMVGYALKLLPSNFMHLKGIGGNILKISHFLNKYSKTSNIKRRALAFAEVMAKKGISWQKLALSGVGAIAGYLTFKGITNIAKYVGQNAIEAIPYSRAMQMGVGSNLGSRMTSFQAAGFGKQRALDWRANLQSQIGNIKLGMGNAGILMSLGLSALDDKNEFEKEIIERMKTLPKDEAVALGQQIGLTYQEVAAARLGLLDKRSFGYSEELMNRYNDLGNAMNQFVAFFETLKYNILGSSLFSIWDTAKNTIGIGLSSKIVAEFQNLNVNIDKDGKASVEGSVESNDINFDSLFQQMGDNK